MNNLLIKEHHLIKKHQIYCLEKVNSRELYNMQIILKVKKPTAQTYFEKNFWNPVLEWKDIYIYILPRRVTVNTNLQNKLLHNILYLNERLYKFGKKFSHFELFAWKNLKAQSIFFILVQKQTFSECSYNILCKTY